jgi:prepilin-type N-terminal cleavage/methylation domain-containing protein
MKSTPSLVSSSSHDCRGFTLPELMVAMFLGLVVGAIMLSSTLANKQAYSYDLKRVMLDQNLRSGMDILGSTIRVGGENLPTSFPAFEIVNGVGSSPDELIVRRNLLDEVLPVCSAIPAGSAALQVYFALGGSPLSACTYSGQTHNFNSWSSYRSSHGGSVRAFIYDVSGKQGEYFNYSNEGSSGTSYYILRSGGSWTYPYPTASSSVYILEEWKIRLNSGVVAVEVNGEPATPNNIIAGVNNFQVNAVMADGTTKTTFLRTDDWSDVTAFEITLSASTSYQKKTINRALTSRFFPRNILSK